MKINKIRFIGDDIVDFPMIGANPSGPFILKGVDGLGPPDVVVTIAPTRQEGGIYQGKRAANRQVVARVGLQPEWNEGQTPEELRTELYGLLTVPFGGNALVQAMYDNTVLGQAYGEVSKIDASLFTKDPEVQITLDCFSPYLLAPAIVSQQPTKTIASGVSSFTVTNTGTAPAGFRAAFTLNSAVSAAASITLMDEIVGGQSMVITGLAWAAGDILTIDTRPGGRGVWRTPSGGSTKTAILNYLDDASPWMMLHKGDNILRFTPTTWDWSPPGFSHTPTFWGV